MSDARESPLICLLPGLGGSGKLYHRLKAVLDDYFEVAVIVFEKGDELDDFVSAALQQIPKDREISLVAESFAGPIAIKLLTGGELRLAPSVLCNTFSSPPYRPLLPLADILPKLMKLNGRFRRVGLKWIGTGLDCSNEVANEILASMKSRDSAIVQSQLRALGTFDVRSLLPQVDTPMLYLQGTRDRLISPSHGKKIVQGLPNCREVRMPGPHFLFQLNPEACATLIRRHVIAV